MIINLLIAVILAAIASFSSNEVRAILSRGTLSSEEAIYLAAYFGVSYIFSYVLVWLMRKLLKR